MGNTSAIGSGTTNPLVGTGASGAPDPLGAASSSSQPRCATATAGDLYEVAGVRGDDSAAKARLGRLQEYAAELASRAPGFRDRMRNDPKAAAAELLTFIAEKPEGLAFLAKVTARDLKELGASAFPKSAEKGDAFGKALHEGFPGIFSNAAYQEVSRRAHAQYKEAAAKLDELARNPAEAAALLTQDGPNLKFLRGLGYDTPGMMRLMTKPPAAADLADLQRRLKDAAVEFRGLAEHEATTKMDPGQYPDLLRRVLNDAGASPFAREAIAGNGSFAEWLAKVSGDAYGIYSKLAKVANLLAPVLDLPVIPGKILYDGATLAIGLYQAAETQRLSDLRGFAGVRVEP